MVDEFDLQTYFMNVYGELDISTGTINVAQTGPVFYNGSLLIMTGGELISNNSIWFNSGSGVNITGGTISIRRDLYNNAGEFAAEGGIVRFFGNLPSEIKGATTFYGLKIEKNAGINVLSSSNNFVADTLIINSGTIVVRNSTLHTGSGN